MATAFSAVMPEAALRLSEIEAYSKALQRGSGFRLASFARGRE
jgi:hypothetical protein